MNGRLLRALLAGGLALLAGLIVDALLNRRVVLLVVLGLLALLAVFGPHLARRFDGVLSERLRWWRWHAEEGRHHSFDGLSLHIEHDARHSWVSGADLQRVLGTRDREDVLAARFSGRWRQGERDGLMLRIDAVVQHLAQCPERMAPRTVKLRRFFEREVLYPAAQRRGTGPSRG